MIDSRKVEDLHPTLQRGFYELQHRMKAVGYDLQTNSTYRDYERQAALYAQGRTTPGKIVTNANAGYSNHNFRIAFDIFKNIRGGEFSDSAFFAKAGAIWEEMGGVWGGHFKSFPDTPHFEYTAGLTTAQLRSGMKLAADAKMKWETVTAPIPGATFSNKIQAGSTVAINKGAKYGGTAPDAKGKDVPADVLAKKWRVSTVTNQNGRDEALLDGLWRYVAVGELTMV